METPTYTTYACSVSGILEERRGPGHIRSGLSESACADFSGPCLQAEAKAAAEQQARLRAEEEARRAAQLKMAAAQGRGTPAGRGQAAPRVGISTCLPRLRSVVSLLHTLLPCRVPAHAPPCCSSAWFSFWRF